MPVRGESPTTFVVVIAVAWFTVLLVGVADVAAQPTASGD